MGQACSQCLEPPSPMHGVKGGQCQGQPGSYKGWICYMREKGAVYLNVAKAPSFLAPGDPERSRLCIAMATCSMRERDISALLSMGSWQLWAHTGAGRAACASAKAEVDEGDIIPNSEEANSLC